MFRRSSLLLCGVAVGMSALSGAAYAAQDDDDDHRGGASYARCPGAEGGDRNGRGSAGDDSDDRSSGRRSRGDGEGGSSDGRGRDGSRSTYHQDLEEPDEMTDPGNRRYRLSCGGLGGDPGVNSSSCGSSLLPAGAGVTSCAAPRARRGLDG